MNISEIMTRDVITISPEASLKEAGALMKEKRISGIPVVDEHGTICGIVTLTDMLRVLNNIYTWKKLQRMSTKVNLNEWHEEEKLKAKVKNIMTRDVYTMSEQDTIDSLTRIVFTKGIHTVPVTKEGKLIGIVGTRDLINAWF